MIDHALSIMVAEKQNGVILAGGMIDHALILKKTWVDQKLSY